MAIEMGESLVGSYLRYVRGCEIVVYNQQLLAQGELDVVGIRLADPREIWLCEVSTHILGIAPNTVARLRKKVPRARDFASASFLGDIHHFEVWCPRVRPGVEQLCDELALEYGSEELDLQFIVNQRYTDCVQELADHARGQTHATSESAYRLLQILTHLRGDLRV